MESWFRSDEASLLNQLVLRVEKSMELTMLSEFRSPVLRMGKVRLMLERSPESSLVKNGVALSLK